MNNLLEKTKELCQLYGVSPARSKGQNFLIDQATYDQMVKAADLKPDDIVLEVGPGLGFLTAKLAAKAKRVIAVELDDKLAAALKTGLIAQNVKNVEVVDGDILKTPLAPLIKGGYKIAANLPYNITSIFLRRFLEAENKPKAMALLLQKEVAERITSGPGEMSLLAISVQFYAEPELIETVPKNYFWPEPAVDSAVVRLEIRNEKFEVNEKDFFRLVKFGFSARRKMLKNNLAAGLKIKPEEAAAKLAAVGLSRTVRAQDLSVGDWLKLLSAFN